MNSFKIPFHQPYITVSSDLLGSIEEVLQSGWVSIGKSVEALEETFRKRYNVEYAVACNNCTSGLIIAVKALGIRARNVVIPAFTWPSTKYAVHCNSNRVLYCDINPTTWLLDMELFATLPFDAIVAVDTFGNQAGTYDYNVPVIYDAAHGWDLPNLGHRGIIEVVSLSHTKLVTAMEGGMILTNDSKIAERCYELRRLSSRMGEINALIALHSISLYDAGVKDLRQEIIKKYEQQLRVPHTRQEIQSFSNDSVYSILIEPGLRNLIVKSLHENNVEYKVYYDPLEPLKNTSFVYSWILSLPVYPGMMDKQDQIIEIINKVYDEYESRVDSTVLQ